MIEHLCPKCGFVWEDDGHAPTTDLKKAVADHLAGNVDSVFGAMLKIREPELRAKMERVQAACEPEDLVRFRRKKLLTQPIEVGAIYCWEPDAMVACEILKVTRIEHRENGDVFVWSMSPSYPREFNNDMSRCREAFVRSWLTLLPNGSVV